VRYAPIIMKMQHIFYLIIPWLWMFGRLSTYGRLWRRRCGKIILLKLLYSHFYRLCHKCDVRGSWLSLEVYGRDGTWKCGSMLLRRAKEYCLLRHFGHNLFAQWKLAKSWDYCMPSIGCMIYNLTMSIFS